MPGYSTPRYERGHRGPLINIKEVQTWERRVRAVVSQERNMSERDAGWFGERDVYREVERAGDGGKWVEIQIRWTTLIMFWEALRKKIGFLTRVVHVWAGTPTTDASCCMHIMWAVVLQTHELGVCQKPFVHVHNILSLRQNIMLRFFTLELIQPKLCFWKNNWLQIK